MVDSEYSTDIYKSVKISIGTEMKNSEMLKFVPDHLKTEKCVSMQLKNYLIYSDVFLINIKLNKCVIKLF